jgi:hypothetical protein
VQLLLNFLAQRQPATPLDRLEPAERAEVVQTLARIITKTARRARLATVREIATTSPTKEIQHD